MKAQTAYRAAAAFVITGAGLGVWFTFNPPSEMTVELVMNAIMGGFLGIYAAFVVGVCYWAYQKTGGEPA